MSRRVGLSQFFKHYWSVDTVTVQLLEFWWPERQEKLFQEMCIYQTSIKVADISSLTFWDIRLLTFDGERMERNLSFIMSSSKLRRGGVRLDKSNKGEQSKKFDSEIIYKWSSAGCMKETGPAGLEKRIYVYLKTCCQISCSCASW